MLNLQSVQFIYIQTRICGPQIRELGGKKLETPAATEKNMISQTLGLSGRI